MGTEEGKEVQAKGKCNIFNKIITENFPIKIQEVSRTLNRFDQNIPSLWNNIIKISTENRERILKALREKKQ
jgi:hypothetical protein